MTTLPTKIPERGEVFNVPCPCGHYVKAVRTPRADGRLFPAYYAIEDRGGIAAGDQVTRCPACGHEFPRLSWDQVTNLFSRAMSP